MKKFLLAIVIVLALNLFGTGMWYLLQWTSPYPTEHISLAQVFCQTSMGAYCAVFLCIMTSDHVGESLLGLLIRKLMKENTEE